MATRFYLPSSGTPPITPAFSASWNLTTGATRLPCYTTPQGTTMTTVTLSDGNEDNANDLRRQWVSEPIGAQTIAAQTIALQMRCQEADSQNNMFLAMTVRVFASDGTTVRGTVLAITRDNTEMATTLTNRSLTATTTSVMAQDGDYLVFEVGGGGDPVGGNHVFNIRIGDAAASDLAQSDSGTTDLRPWIEFANDITFQGAGGGATNVHRLPLLGVG